MPQNYVWFRIGFSGCTRIFLKRCPITTASAASLSGQKSALDSQSLRSGDMVYSRPFAFQSPLHRRPVLVLLRYLGLRMRVMRQPNLLARFRSDTIRVIVVGELLSPLVVVADSRDELRVRTFSLSKASFSS